MKSLEPPLFLMVALRILLSCVLFSLALRGIIFLVELIIALAQHGGERITGITFYHELQRATRWYEIGGWIILALLIIGTHPRKTSA